MKKVAVIGTHGVRKTTICHSFVAALKERGVNADYLGEIARDAERAGFKLNEGTTRESQRWILHTQISRELEFGKRRDVDVLVCDRCVFDNYMYYVNHFGSDVILDQIVNEHVKSYYLLLKIPLNEGSLNADSVRAVDREFQRKIGELLDDELKKREISFQNYEGIAPALEIILGKAS